MATKTIPDSDFPARFGKLFPGRTHADITRLLGYKSQSSVRDIFDGKYIPEVDTLIKIVNLTGCSLDWLLFGKSQDYKDPLGVLDEARAAVVRKLASEGGVSVRKTVNEIVDKGMTGRAADLMGRLSELTDKERAQLRVLSELLLDHGTAKPAPDKREGRQGGKDD